MNAAQMAHFLKELGKGDEQLGIINVYQTGRLVGVGQTLAGIAAVYAVYRIGKWGYEKLAEYLQERRCLAEGQEV